jgi:hypothetical protein
MRPLDAVVWPQDLIEAFNGDQVADRTAIVLARKRPVVGRVPVLSSDDEFIIFHQSIRHEYDLVPIRHRQGATGQEVVLDVD